MSFNQGLQGTATGSAMNSVGLMYHGAMTRSNEGAAKAEETKTAACLKHEVRWVAEGACFEPTQFHVNVLLISLVLNVTFLVLFVLLLLKIKKDKK